MRNLLFVAASTSHASCLVSPSSVRPTTSLAGRSLSARTVSGGILATASSRHFVSAWPLHQAGTPVAVSTRRISAAGRTIALTTSTRCHEKAHKGNAGGCYEKSCLRRIVVVFERVQQKLPTPQWRPPLDCDRTTAP
jgi:hypothetical protein